MITNFFWGFLIGVLVVIGLPSKHVEDPFKPISMWSPEQKTYINLKIDPMKFVIRPSITPNRLYIYYMRKDSTGFRLEAPYYLIIDLNNLNSVSSRTLDFEGSR